MNEGPPTKRRWFQFSLKRLLGSIALFSVAIAVWQIPIPNDFPDLLFLGGIFVTSVGAGGAALGLLAGKMRMGLLIGAGLALAWCLFLAGRGM